MSKVVKLNKPQPKKPTQHSVTEEGALGAIYYFWQTNALEDINTLEIDDNTIL